VTTINAGDVGRRVTIRRRLPEGGYSDVVGMLERADESTLAVRDKKGRLIEIARAEIALSKLVPSQPSRRNTRKPAQG
jgi:hypothetical protein